MARLYPSPANFVDWREASRSFEGLAAFRTWFCTLSGEREAEQVWGVRVSASLFGVLGVGTALGRTFAENKERVVVFERRGVATTVW